MYRKKAFTLIELLVVIAIIGLLLAIVAPALRLAKERSQFIFCKTNLKSYGLTMKLYLQENDDAYPVSYDSMFSVPTATVPLGCQWHDKRTSPANVPQHAGPLWPYMAKQEASLCPTFKSFAKAFGAEHVGPPENPGRCPNPIEPQYAYSQNHFLGGRVSYPSGTPYGVVKQHEVVDPGGVIEWVEETIWFVPPVNVNRWVLNDTCFFTRHPDDTVGLGDFIATYHGTSLARRNAGKGNAVFVDGHVELCDPYDSITLSSGKVISGGFRLAWPKKGKLSNTKLY
ncbi:MAG: type II secretion system protein [Phycisphaerae bacterium]|nr:type II secretion system protein [Phycisphaerae bacterium]